MATIDEDNDIYNGGGGGGGAIDPDSIPDEQNIFLGTNSWFTDGVPDKGWFQHPIAMFQVAGGSNRIWLSALRKEYSVSDANKKPPFLINDSSQALKSRYLELNFESYYSSANHQAVKKFLLLDIGLLANSDDGKFVKLKKISGGIWDYELDTPSSTPELFEVYIDEYNAANNRNVNYNDIVSALSAGKLVYLKVLDFSSPNIYTYVFSYHDVGNKDLHFTLIEVFGGCTVVDYVIKDDNSYSYKKIDPMDLSCGLDESFTPPVKYNFTFSTLKQWYNSGDSLSPQIYLRYKNANGDYYKLRAVKLTSTQIMFSVYDPDTARNLSIILNDQDQYTVIT